MILGDQALEDPRKGVQIIVLSQFQNLNRQYNDMANDDAIGRLTAARSLVVSLAFDNAGNVACI